MQTILLATDFSEAARNATDFAARLAQVFKARIILFHAYMLPTPASEIPYVMATVDELQQENETLVKKEATAVFEKYQVEAEGIVRIGIPSDEIRSLCEENNIDLVVMGMHGTGGLDKLIGSTTTNTARKLSTPVLIIPIDCRYSPLQEIIYASDYDYKTNYRLFGPLVTLAQSFQASVHILNVDKEQVEEKAADLIGQKDIAQVFQDLPHEFVTRQAHSIVEGIVAYEKEQPADLLVMVAHQHNFLERLFTTDHALAMAYKTTIPMLVLQDK